MARYMTRKQLTEEFREDILPGIQARENGRIDVTMRREAWNDWTDALCKEGRISGKQYNTDPGLPNCFEPRRR